MVGITTPEPILMFALLGAGCIHYLRERRAVIILFVVNALFIPAMGLLPGAVLHDGARQLLSAIPFLAALAGGGFYTLVRFISAQAVKIGADEKIRHLRPKIIAIGLVLFLFQPALDLLVYHPFELSYYNRLVGGIRGAYEKGLEATYFMEAFNPDFLSYLNNKLPPRAVINASFANFMFQYYQKKNRLRPDIQITDQQTADYYILLTRRSIWSKREWNIFHTHSALATVRLGVVPLVTVYHLRGFLPENTDGN
jgi:hypothetical protein